MVFLTTKSVMLGGLGVGLLLLATCVSMGGAETFPADQIQIDDLISSLTLDDNAIDKGQTLVRKVRQAPATLAPPDIDLNLADDVSEDYPVIFNIILFLAITLILALIAISVALATMDPGRDSLIYRVTSAQRFKKDN